MQKLQIIILILTFYSVGGAIDYWQSAMEHKKKIPKPLLDYFLVIWLFIYSGVIPFLLVFVASSYNLTIAKTFIGAVFIGMSLWDIAFSIFDTKSIVSSQEIYFCMKGKNYGLNKRQLYLWHFIRWFVGIMLLIK